MRPLRPLAAASFAWLAALVSTATAQSTDLSLGEVGNFSARFDFYRIDPSLLGPLPGAIPNTVLPAPPPGFTLPDDVNFVGNIADMTLISSSISFPAGSQSSFVELRNGHYGLVEDLVIQWNGAADQDFANVVFLGDVNTLFGGSARFQPQLVPSLDDIGNDFDEIRVLFGSAGPYTGIKLPLGYVVENSPPVGYVDTPLRAWRLTPAGTLSTGQQARIKIAFDLGVPVDNTPVSGSSVAIQPVDRTTLTSPATVTFDSISAQGQTSLTTSTDGPAAPAGFLLGTPNVYYHISTTATFSGEVEIRIDYTGIHFDHEESLKLMHTSNGVDWTDITTSLDTINHVIIGATPSFSIFAIVESKAPVANAGPDQAIHVGQTVHLDGSGSFDDNASSDLLGYAWSITSAPAGSTAHLTNGNTMTPAFVADLPGSYLVSLIVTNLDHVASQSDSVQISSLNQAPTADAGANAGGVVGSVVTLSGAGSSDPDHDALAYAWTIVSKPKKSTATLVNGTGATPSFTPDVHGAYTIQLIVNDGFAASPPDATVITVVTPVRYAEALTMDVITTSRTLPASFFSSAGNKRSFESLLHDAAEAMQEDELREARQKLQDAIARTDGWTLRGRADPTGSGRDWVVDATTSAAFYAALNTALGEITLDETPRHEHDDD